MKYATVIVLPGMALVGTDSLKTKEEAQFMRYMRYIHRGQGSTESICTQPFGGTAFYAGGGIPLRVVRQRFNVTVSWNSGGWSLLWLGAAGLEAVMIMP